MVHSASLLILASRFLLSDATPSSTLIARQNNAYAAVNIQCPENRPATRTADSLSRDETEWLQLRRNATLPALRDFLSRANIGGFEVNSYLDSLLPTPANLPNIGIAVSGGGYRALLNGAGVLSAFDSRTANATAQGHLGGLLQAATYLSGLSGGSWLIGSLYKNDFANVQALLNGSAGLSSLWQFDQSIFGGPNGMSTLSYFDGLFRTVQAKENAGYETTLTDYWGRALSYQLFDSRTGSPDYHFSNLADGSHLSSGQAPLPLVVVDQRAPNSLLLPVNSTNFEVSPWEFGTYDASTNAFAPIKYLASEFNGGTVSEGRGCRVGFDNIGFVVGTSSSLFNQFLLNLNSTSLPDFAKGILQSLLTRFSASNNDISVWPNPFFGFNSGTASNAAVANLTLVDGGEDLQNVPLHPLLWNQRNVDIIFAVDSSADTPTFWPNGTSLVATYERLTFGPNQSSLGFPSIPDVNTFVNLGLNSRPTFFGCNANNQSTQAPLIVYVPNGPYTFRSNISTYDLDYTDNERNSVVRNGYAVATRANSTLDSEWPACVGCAILSRSFNRTRVTIPQTCVGCFSRYCWNGTVNSTTPKVFEPKLIIATSIGHSTGPQHIMILIVALFIRSLIII